MYTSGCALRHRRRRAIQHAALRRVQCVGARRAGDRGTRAAWTVRHGQAIARHRSAAQAAVLDLRNPARRQRPPDWHLDPQQAHRRRHASRLRRGTGLARHVSRASRPSLRAGRSAGAGLDGRGRRRAGAVPDARRSPRRPRDTDDALLWRAPGARPLLHGRLRTISASRSCHRPKMAASAPRDSSPDR